MAIPKTCGKAKNFLLEIRLQTVHKILPRTKANIHRGKDFRKRSILFALCNALTVDTVCLILYAILNV